MSKWPMVKLGELVSIRTGKLDANAADQDGVYPFFTCAIEALTINTYAFDCPAILLAGNGDLNVKKYRGKFNAYQRTYVIVSDEQIINLDFLYLFLKKYINTLRQQSIGGVIKYIKLNMLTDAVIPLPPLEEQKRIVDLLDRAQALIDKRKEQLALMDTLTQSLFYEMFGDPVKNEKGWEMKSLSDLTTKIGSGATPRGGDASYKSEGIPLIRSLNVRMGTFLYKDLAYIDDSQADALNNVIVEKNDILLNITGASVARVCIVPNDLIPARVNQHVAIIRCNDRMNPQYLSCCLLTESMQTKLWNIAESGATRQAITKQQIEAFTIPLPPISVQNDYVHKIQSQLLMKQKMEEIGKSIDKLFSSIMSEAFD